MRTRDISISFIASLTGATLSAQAQTLTPMSEQEENIIRPTVMVCPTEYTKPIDSKIVTTCAGHLYDKLAKIALAFDAAVGTMQPKNPVMELAADKAHTACTKLFGTNKNPTPFRTELDRKTLQPFSTTRLGAFSQYFLGCADEVASGIRASKAYSLNMGISLPESYLQNLGREGRCLQAYAFQSTETEAKENALLCTQGKAELLKVLNVTPN